METNPAQEAYSSLTLAQSTLIIKSLNFVPASWSQRPIGNVSDFDESLYQFVS